MKVLKQALFTDPFEIMELGIIDWGRLNGTWPNEGAAVKTIGRGLLGNATYTSIERDLRGYPERADWPGWQHAGNHEYLGRLYWNMFRATFPHSELVFADEPDFYGTIREGGIEQSLWGDIGRVSAQCFALTVGRMRPGDLWVSVLDEQRQVIIESHHDYQQAITDALGITGAPNE